ncbi:MAG: SDR family NAD(P)-dependent oxidoreductase [Rhodospirillales bacterium]|nr:SDR family NAD(P)-dependent oxidoreductase [Rhodospirillales bacterium]
MNWNDTRVLVTGADGFIGSHLVESLVKRGARVTALACYNAFDGMGWLDEVPAKTRAKLQLARGDVRDGPQMADLCRGQDVIFHLAALIGIPYSYAAPASYVATNIQGTLNVLAAAHAANAKRVVQTSTSEVYGTALRTPIGEDHPLQAQSPYAASKIGADAMAEAFARSFNLPVVTLRPFNTYGPRQSERAVIPTIIRQVLDPTATSIALGSLAPKRDFTFVEDTAEAFVLAAELGSEHRGHVYNAGSGRMISIGELVEIICRLTKISKPIREEQIRQRPAESEVMMLLADSSAFNKATGWTPRVNFDEGLKRTIAWWQTRQGRMRPDLAYAV